MNPPRLRDYPKQVYVHNEIYRVLWRRTLGDDGPNRYVLGICDGDEKTISLKLGLGRYKTFVTFIHEIIHAIEFEHKFQLEHAMVNKLDCAIAQLLLVNDDAVAMFLAAMGKPPLPHGQEGHPRKPHPSGAVALLTRALQLAV